MFSVHLCIGNLTKGFRCQEFENYLEADKYCSEYYKAKAELAENELSTLIPTIKYAPQWIMEPYLNRQLLRIFVKPTRVVHQLYTASDLADKSTE